MITYDANWELFYLDYPRTLKEEKKSKNRRRKESKKLREVHNNVYKKNSKKHASDMIRQPSELEKRMKLFLDEQNIDYEFQKILYIKDKRNMIQRYYIVDFYIPKKDLIIETDGRFHDDQIEKDEKRTKDIKYHYPNMHIIRWRWHDFDSSEKIKALSERLK